MKDLLSRILILTCALIISVGANAEKKVALIVGNQTYSDSKFQTLPTCINDANAMDKALKNLGFQTIVVLDANKDSFLDSFEKFSNILKDADVAVFFFSGHATNIAGDLYLIPSKTTFRAHAQSDQFVKVANIREIMQENSKLSLLFFDACRDGATTGYGLQTKGGTRRKSSTSINANNTPEGCMLFYATQNGRTASPGTGTLSPFTKILIDHINDGDEFRYVWQNIKTEVPSIQPGQYPSSEETYSGNFYFNKTGVKITPPSNKNVDTEKKLSITINCNVPNTQVDFYGSKYNCGESLLFKIGNKYVFTINKDGYQPYTGTIDVTESTPSTFMVNLIKEQTCILRISTNTNTVASVSLDGKYIGDASKNKILNIQTTTGKHSLKLSADKYIPYKHDLDLHDGNNFKYVTLYKDIPVYWGWDGDYSGENAIRYHFSPKYQIGFSLMHRTDSYRFSYGLILAASTEWFRGVFSSDNILLKSDNEVSSTITVEEDGVATVYNVTTKNHSGDTDNIYSSEKDPYNEAKRVSANALILGNIGYNICNGAMIEFGIGAGYNRDRYFMPTTYNYTETITSNQVTGEIIGEPEYTYKATGISKYYNGSSKWSPALRLGTKWYIPLDDFVEYSITLGCGYTYLPMNHKYSSWDVNIGFSWYF